MTTFARWLLAATILAAPAGFASRLAGDVRTFEKDIRPIFRKHCFDCHGATDELKGELDLRLVRFLKKGGDSGAAIVAGKPEESHLLERIRSGEMPPGDHRVPAAEVKIIEQWIAGGAQTARPEPESIGVGLGITPEERSFWSFQPIARPDVPPVESFPSDSRVRTPIDTLLLSAENVRGSKTPAAFSPDADRATLVRRAYLNLLGLPPTPDEMSRWLQAESGDWYAQMLDELLESPHYGERWARHWLDIAGYADSEGYTVTDAVRSWSWKYRDWVVRALNADKPFDRFLVEQMAGDELAGARNGDLTAEQIELLTATGFLRMAADGTDSGADNPAARNQVMADTLKIIGTSLLGLSVHCAQCHDHRYDPIPQTDYYALRAVFEPALDWKAWKRPRDRRISLYTAADRQRAATIEAEARKIGEKKGKKQAEYMKQALEKELLKFKEPLRTRLRDAYETIAAKRTDEQKKLLAANPSVNINPGVLYQYLPKAAEELKKFDQQMAEVRAKKPVEQFLRALVEPPNHAPETKLFFRGDYQQPKQTVEPGGLTVSASEGQRPTFPANAEAHLTTGRRLALARWLTRGDHPLVARVIVNRVWMHHFGRGLVPTPSDFGRLGSQPTHPELLDWLATEFVREGWSLKKLHRLIMTSTAWRQSGQANDAATGDVAAQQYLRKPLVRLDAEVIRDSILAASGQLDRTQFGAPVAVKEDDTGQVIVESPRRSLYVQVRRSRPVAMMQAFDAPVMETNCEVRPRSTVATQSLMLMNSRFVLEQSGKLADRAAGEAQPLAAPRTAAVTQAIDLPRLGEGPWQYGYGRFDERRDRTGWFDRLPHFTGTAWQGGPKLPDPKLGWVLLTAAGGHPDSTDRSAIRRWTATQDGAVSITGELAHRSENGDGVVGRIVSSRSGTAGNWTARNGSKPTAVKSLIVKTGDTIDFIIQCGNSIHSDSFNWPVTLNFTATGRPNRAYASQDAFHGPIESPQVLLGQIVRAWELALCREPTEEELVLAAQFVSQQIETLRATPAAVPKGRTAARQSLTNLCQTLFSSNEFLYSD